MRHAIQCEKAAPVKRTLGRKYYCAGCPEGTPMRNNMKVVKPVPMCGFHRKRAAAASEIIKCDTRPP